MRSRLSLFTLILYLWFGLAACNKPANQPSDTGATDNNAAPSAQKASPTRTRQEAEKPKPAPIVVPAGTTLTVSLGQSVGSKISQPGQSFSATLSDAVQVGGVTAIPAGANATGTVVDAKPLGRFKGGASLVLKLTSINVNGEDRQIQTSAVSQSIKGKGKRTAVLAGGGAGLGALIGGLAGGGKGAAIGAVAGVGAGGAGAAFTGNKDIVLPAESALTFKLNDPLEVKVKE